MAPNDTPTPEMPEDMDIPEQGLSQNDDGQDAQQDPGQSGEPEAFILPVDSYFSPDSFKGTVERTMQFHKAASKAAADALTQSLASDPETVLKFYDSSINGVHKMMMAAIKANDSLVKSNSFNAAQNSRNKLPSGSPIPKDPPAPNDGAPASEGTPEPETPAAHADPAPEPTPRLEPGDLSHSRFQDIGS